MSALLAPLSCFQRHYTKTTAIAQLREELATRDDPSNVTDAYVLKALRTLLFTSSQFSYGVRGASFSAEDVNQINLRAKDVVSII